MTKLGRYSKSTIASTGAVHKAAGAQITATLRLKPGGDQARATLEVEVASVSGESLGATRPTVAPGDGQGRFAWAAKEAVQWSGAWPYTESCPGTLRPGKGNPSPLTVEVTFTGADGKARTETVSLQVAQP